MLDGDSIGRHSLRGMLHGIKRGLATKTAVLDPFSRGFYNELSPAKPRTKDLLT